MVSSKVALFLRHMVDCERCTPPPLLLYPLPRAHHNQLSIQTAKSDAERAFREFENRSRGEEQDIQERLGKELARLEKETAAAKAKAAMDVSRAQVRYIDHTTLLIYFVAGLCFG